MQIFSRLINLEMKIYDINSICTAAVHHPSSHIFIDMELINAPISKFCPR